MELNLIHWETAALKTLSSSHSRRQVTSSNPAVFTVLDAYHLRKRGFIGVMRKYYMSALTSSICIRDLAYFV